MFGSVFSFIGGVVFTLVVLSALVPESYSRVLIKVAAVRAKIVEKVKELLKKLFKRE